MPNSLGPLVDDFYVSIAISVPLFAGDGPYVVIRWSEPDFDQVRHYRIRPELENLAVAEWVGTVVYGYLVSRGSAVRRALAAFERTSSTLPG